MTCEEIRSMIDREGALVTGDAHAHVHDCPSCQETWNRWQEVQRTLHAFGEEDTPPFLHTRVMAHVREAEAEEANKKGAWFFGLKKIWAGPLLVLFIGVLLGGYGMVQVLRTKGVEPTPQGANRAETPAKDKKAQPSANAGPAKEALAEAKPRRADAPAEPAAPPAVPAPVQVTTEGQDSSLAVEQEGKGERDRSLFAPSPAPEGTQSPSSHQTLASRSAADEVPGGAVQGNIAVQREPAGVAIQKSVQAPGPGASNEVLQAESGPSEVVCTLSPLTGSGPYITLQLPPEAAPPSGGMWTIQVSEEGGLRIQDALGKNLSVPTPTIASVIRPLHVPSGSYRLKRIS